MKPRELYLWNHRAPMLAFLLALSFFARSENTDSLRNAVNAYRAEDTTKVKLYADLAGAYRYTGPDSILYYADKGLALAEKLQYERGKAKCLVKKTLACLISGDHSAGLRFSAAAITILKKTSDSTEMAMAYYYVAAIYYSQSKFDTSVEYYRKVVNALSNTGRYDLAGDALDNMGVCYSSTGNFAEALKYYLEGLKVREKDHDKNGIATSQGNIGRVYASLGNKKKALEYINKSIASQEGSTPDILMINYENAGNVYLTIKDTAKAMVAFETAVQMADSARQPAEINRITVNLAEVLLQMEQYDRAFELYQRCVANNAIPNMPAVDAMIHRGLGRIYSYKKNYSKGARELELAVGMFKENDMKDHYTETLKDLAFTYGAMHSYDRAFHTLALYHSSRDSIQSEETDKKVQELQYDYDLQKKQTEIERLAKDNALAQGKADKRLMAEIGMISGLLLLCTIIAIMYRNRNREKAAKNLIVQQAASLAELNSYKDKILSVVSHDMRGPISALDTLLKMLDEDVITPKEFSELKPQVHKQLASVTLLLDNLLRWSSSQLTGKQTARRDQLDLYNLVSQNVRLMQGTAADKKITVNNNVPTGTMATGDARNIDIVIRNLISNALKFTNPGGMLTITSNTMQGKTELSFADTGIGLKEDQLKRLFTKSPESSSAGTMGEPGTGLGLLISYEFAKANDGNIRVASVPGKGSTFTLVLPGATAIN